VNYGINACIQYKALEMFSFVNSRIHYFKLCSVLSVDVFRAVYVYVYTHTRVCRYILCVSVCVYVCASAVNNKPNQLKLQKGARNL
jgi:hypothetical protein